MLIFIPLFVTNYVYIILFYKEIKSNAVFYFQICLEWKIIYLSKCNEDLHNTYEATPVTTICSE